MKIIGLVMIFMGCAGIGYMVDVAAKMRIKELWALITVFETLRGDIDYLLTPLPEACIQVANRSTHKVGCLFKNFGNALEQRESVDTGMLWRRAIEEEKHQLHLKKEDYEVLYDFWGSAGSIDKEMQQNQIKLLLIKLREIAERGETNAEKTTKLNTGMGVLIGACICIFLI